MSANAVIQRPRRSTDHAETRRYTERIYGFLADDEDARVCTEIPPTACDDQPKSFVLQLFALTLTNLGDALASPRLVLAWMRTRRARDFHRAAGAVARVVRLAAATAGGAVPARAFNWKIFVEGRGDRAGVWKHV